ncbi:hypothetical protein TorRG33x02_281240 [Trema orientale]|uniref:Uncharacterized protein n=1 Tax=Trema orientale TaxID=63057 RepID=A0A2P5CKR1_TREOI|nr:hypothetical protein TorRG33x02_281240 [Trema orientale]
MEKGVGEGETQTSSVGLLTPLNNEEAMNDPDTICPFHTSIWEAAVAVVTEYEGSKERLLLFLANCPFPPYNY